MTRHSRLVFYFSSCPLKERLVTRLCADYGRWLGGFRTFEARQGASRAGYELQALGGPRVPLASKEILSPVAFNKYGLNLEALEVTALGALEAAQSGGKILLMDELGAMAMRSPVFSARAVELLFSTAPCLVFCRRGAKVFEEAFARLEGSGELELTEETWAEAVLAARAWLDARIVLMETE